MARDAQELPLISDIKNKLRNKKFYARFDHTAGFNELTLDDPSREILAFHTPKGLHQPVRLPFGPKNGPTIYQKVSAAISSDVKGYGVSLFVYNDDVIRYADDEAELV